MCQNCQVRLPIASFLCAAGLIRCAESGDVIVLSDQEVDSGVGGLGGSDDPGQSPSPDGGAGPVDGSGGAAPMDKCGGFLGGSEIRLCAASYSSSGPDSPVDITALSESELFVATNSTSPHPDAEAAQALGMGPGRIVRWGKARSLPELQLQLSGEARALGADLTRKRIIAATETQLVAVSDDFSQVYFQVDLTASATRLDVSPSGAIAVLDDEGVVTLYAPSGALRESFLIADESGSSPEPVVNDVALSTDGETVFVVGAHDDPSGDCPGRVPFLRAYERSGTVLARAYDFDDMMGNCASSVGRRVALGGDGHIYYAGENHGGNTVHLRSPQDITQQAPLVSFDIFNQGYGQAIERYGFIARFGPDLTMESGTLILPRDADERGGEYLIDGIEADKDGNVAISARSTCCIPEREAVSVEGESAGAYNAPELTLLLLSADFRERHAWFTPTASGVSPTEPRGLTWFGNRLSVAAELGSGTEMMTKAPAHEGRTSPNGGYVLSMPTP